jgi:hypothetical protein
MIVQKIASPLQLEDSIRAKTMLQKNAVKLKTCTVGMPEVSVVEKKRSIAPIHIRCMEK